MAPQQASQFNLDRVLDIVRSPLTPVQMFAKLRDSGLMIPMSQGQEYLPLIKDICLHILPKCNPEELEYIITGCMMNLTIVPKTAYANNHQVHRRMIHPEESKLRRVRIAVLWLIYGKAALKHKQVVRFLEDFPKALDGFPQEASEGMKDIIDYQKKVFKQKRAPSLAIDTDARKKVPKKTHSASANDDGDDRMDEREEVEQPETPSQMEDTVLPSVANSPMDFDSPEIIRSKRPAVPTENKCPKEAVKVEKPTEIDNPSTETPKTSKKYAMDVFATPAKIRAECLAEAVSNATSHTLRVASDPSTPVRGARDVSPSSLIRHKSATPGFEESLFIEQETSVPQVSVKTPDATKGSDFRTAKQNFRRNVKATITSMMDVMELSKDMDREETIRLSDELAMVRLQMEIMEERMKNLEASIGIE
ncbi:hypothetical protein VHEMI01602 [[Torrubiella] hemipterigena]|uniref:Uncharacterized protein n=1 Tax=[Torrubiella] hemipterigena TaxID=1531966 RepID=A0A0A1T5T4_9HYPO|nr:hypothetical protein VHEMI01602 [[Torrubiella] hemipterigena]